MKSRLVLLALIILAVGCNADKEEDSVISGPGYLTASQLAGTWTVCQDASGKGNDFPAPSSFQNSLTINADSTYSFSQYMYTGTTNCSPIGAPGPFDQKFAYSQTGTINPVGLATSPAGATQVEFTSDETIITFYDAAVESHFIASCPTFTINHGMDSSRNADTPPCNVGSDVFFGEFFGAVFTSYNVLSLDTTTTPHTLSTGDHFDWQPGMGPYPASLVLDYEKN